MSGSEYTLGRFVLRPHRQLLCDGAPVAIRRKPLELLSVLAEAEGALVTKDELMTKVWSRSVVEDNALHAQVATVRKLLGEEGARLSTVRGLGYRLEATRRAPVAQLRTEAPQEGGGANVSGANGAAVEAASEAVGRRPARVVVVRRAAVALAVVLAVGVAGLIGWRVWRGRGSEASLPPDRAAAALFVQARDEWARRDASSLGRSIAHFERVTRLAPRFAPAFADLADAYLLAGEAGSLSDAVAFDGAEHAALRARRLDANSAGAYRALGFIRYWRRGDRPGAAAAFRTALRLDPFTAQTHFWYANALADNGEFGAAQREFDRARLADPGSDQIGADYGWALWSQGREAEGAALVRAVADRDPSNAEAQDCLAGILLAEGDDAGFLRAVQARARLRGEPTLAERAALLARAQARGGRPALLKAAFDFEMARQADAPFPDHSDAAFYASLGDDRPALQAALAAADAANERWGAAGYVARMRVRWRGDAPIVAALARRGSPRMEDH